ncbi:MAG: hypothetical protein ACOC9E_03380 [Chloroflexota bacterium]
MILTKTLDPARVETFSEALYTDIPTLNLYAETAHVHIESHPFDRVDVEARLRDVELRVWQEDGNVLVHAENDVAEDGATPLRPKAEIVIKAPAACETYIQIVTGSLFIRDLSAAVRTHVITGQTTLQNLDGRILAECVTGNIDYAGRLVDGMHRFMTTTGAVRLALNEPPNARVYAWATTGRVQCDLALSEKRRGGYFTGDHLYGVSGSGEGRILAEVVTGSIRIGTQER